MLKCENDYKAGNGKPVFFAKPVQQPIQMKPTCVFLLVLIPFFFLSMTCRKETDLCHYSVWLNNTTDKPVFVAASYDYPDTSINFQNPLLGENNYVGAHNRVAFMHLSHCLEYDIETLTPSGKLSIFVFDAEKLRYDTSWSQIRRNYQVLKRFDYSIDELRNTNFSVDFP